MSQKSKNSHGRDEPKADWVLRIVVLIAFLLIGNWFLQVVKKPTEIIGFFDSSFFKSPSQTWNTYKDDFVDNSTRIISPQFLAALAQKESGGNPIARTYWQFNSKRSWHNLFAPASTSVGLYQITDPTFEESKRYCIRNNRAVAEGPWYYWKSCWFNSLYFRVFPSHSIEMTSAYLDIQTRKILKRLKLKKVSTRNKQMLAAVIHLCGKRKGHRFAKQGFRVRTLGKCGSHNASKYVASVMGLKKKFLQFQRP